MIAHDAIQKIRKQRADLDAKLRQAESLIGVSPYDRKRMKAAEKSRQQTFEVQNIGTPPEIADPERREKTKLSFRSFLDAYAACTIPGGVLWPWSTNHLSAIARLEEAVLRGARYVFAMPRGHGKTLLCRLACVWALAHAHSRYVFLVGANQEKAQESIEAIKALLLSEPFASDFPEISHPVRELEGKANKAKGQHCNSRRTEIRWTKDSITLPTIEPPPNWPEDWPLAGEVVPSSGSIVAVSGLTGSGIRGSLRAMSTGEQIRPDVVLLDDPQTDESATSISQNAMRERLISGAVLGMAAPGKTISAVMPCTVIAPGDMADRLLTREIHPLWRGERTSLLDSMPTNLGEWDKYFEVYFECAQREPPDYEVANEYYLKHRDILDAGAKANWDHRKGWEVSAIQHAMNIYGDNPTVFFAEYQNQPMLEHSGVTLLTAEQIAAKIHGFKRGLIPSTATHLSVYIDVQKDALYYLVAAWQKGMTGYVIDYGSYPDQGVDYFTLRQVRVPLAAAMPGSGLAGSITAGLNALADKILRKAWPMDGGGEMRVNQAMVDCNWDQSTEAVVQWCRSNDLPVYPSRGKGISAGGRPMGDWPKHPGELHGYNWLIPRAKRGVGRIAMYDTNFWKTLVYAGIATALGDPGSVAWFKCESGRSHRMLADHIRAEHPTATAGHNRQLVEWKHKPGKPDNHFWDCLVGSAVAASIAGVEVGGTAKPKSAETKSLSFAELKKRARRV